MKHRASTDPECHWNGAGMATASLVEAVIYVKLCRTLTGARGTTAHAPTYTSCLQYPLTSRARVLRVGSTRLEEIEPAHTLDPESTSSRIQEMRPHTQ